MQLTVFSPIAKVVPEGGVHAIPGLGSAPSSADGEKVTTAPPGLVAFTVTAAGTVSVGALRSTRFPPIGPAVAQLPAASQTDRVPVCAFASSDPTATFVARAKDPSPVASPEPPS